MTPVIPVIETERLILRAHTQADLPACAAMWEDPGVVKYTIGVPSPYARTWIRLMAYLGHWSLLGYGYWAVEEKASSRYIGELGFADFKRDITPSIEGMPELGWALEPHAHGKGYATEALRAVVAWGEQHFGPKKKLACIINPENTASLRVADKLGFKEWVRTTKEGHSEIIFVRPST